jgi:hypothetical protein
LITVALASTIDAPGERVWRAVVDPTERSLWDDRIVGEIRLPAASARLLHRRRGARGSCRDARASSGDDRAPSRSALDRRPDEPIGRSEGDTARVACWRFRLASVPLVLVDEIHGVEGGDRLIGRIAIGSMRFEQSVTLHEEHDESGPRARLGMKLVAGNRIAVLGELIPRIEVQRILIEYVDTTLRQIRKHCEAAP